MDARRFIFLTTRELLAQRKSTKQDFAVFTVHAASVDEGRIRVLVSLDWIGLRRGRMVHQISDWAMVFFRFDCETNEFQLDGVRLGGI